MTFVSILHGLYKHTLFNVFLAVVNACKSNPCKHGGTCSTNGIDYKCTCVIGYEGDDCKGGLYCFRYYRLIVCFITYCDTMN